MKKETKLTIVKAGEFLGTKCDFYKDENDSIFMTRNQIGEALQYSDPNRNISKLHIRNKARLDKFSVVVELTTTDQKEYDTHLYSERGIYEICRFSRQKVANDFYDWVYDQIELIRRNAGTIQKGREKEFLDSYFPSFSDSIKRAMVDELSEKVQEKQDEIDKMKPMVDDWKAFLDTKGNLTMSEIAKTLNIDGIGRNNLFAILRDNKVLRANNEPYQRFVNSGYFEIMIMVNPNNKIKYPMTMVTTKGMSWVNKKVKEWGYA